MEQSPHSLTAAFALWRRFANTFSGRLVAPRSIMNLPVTSF
jgi:hypothetical protein